MKEPVVLVIGTGTIGEPLIGLLCDIKDQVGIGEVLFHKQTPRIEDRPKIANLIRRGARLCIDEMKLNTQYMHAIWFDLLLRRETSLEEVTRRLKENDRIAITYKKSSNLVFSFGRDHGHYGRILNNTVVVLPSLQLRGGREVIGFCFTPQDGNSLLSSVSAALWLLYPEDYEQRLQALRPFFYNEV